MGIFKCKMCGGNLEINGNETVATCEYCGTQLTEGQTCTTEPIISGATMSLIKQWEFMSKF